jgi:calcineurin-like phosphoesterase
MQKDVPMNRFLTGIGGHFDIAKKCQAIFQLIVFELDDEGRGVSAQKVKIYDNGEVRMFDARIEKY